MTRVLVVTNDFPPRPGGIQTFVYELIRRLPPEDVTVYCSKFRGWEEFDAAQQFQVVREDTSVLLPTRSVRRRAAELLRETASTAVLFGAAAPLGLMGNDLRDAGAKRIVALTHGHEAGWAAFPGPRQVLRRIGDRVDVMTYLGEYTRSRIARALSPAAAARMVRLTPGVDTDRFRRDVDGGPVRDRYGLGDRPVVVCVSRLMPRKGQDTLIKALPEIRRRVPDTALLLVGGGPYRKKLQQLAQRLGVAEHVIFTGSVPYAELPMHFAAGDVFAMPCRTRNAGLDVEGLGIVFLEASATGLPVVAGDSGGAPDAVLDAETGFVVAGRDGSGIAGPVGTLLTDRDIARRLGSRGRSWVLSHWGWDRQVSALRAILDQ